MNTNQARATYTQAIETTKSAAAELERRKAASNDPQLAITAPNKKIELLEADIAHMNAQAAERVAAHALALQLASAEVASGDELAVLFDRAGLAADLHRLVEVETALESELVAARKVRAARLAAAHAAHADVSARRRTEGLPPPPPLPPLTKSLPHGRVPLPLAELFLALEGPHPTPAPVDQARLSDMERYATALRIDAEKAARKREEEEKAEAERREEWSRRAADGTREAKAKSEEHGSLIAKHAAEQRELEESYKARQAAKASTP